MTTSRALACLTVFSLLGLASPALALNPNPAAEFYYTTEVGDPTGTAPLVENSLGYALGASHTQVAQTALGTTAISSSSELIRDIPGFEISASVTAVPDPGAGVGIPYRSYAEAETNIIFYITANGAVGSLIPVNVKALLRSTGSQDPNYLFGMYGIATGFTKFEIRDNQTDSPPNDYVYANCPFQGCPNATTLNIDQDIQLIADTTYEVQESVFVVAGALPNDQESLTATATADPLFEIPYSYDLANPGVSLSISPGLQSLVAVPEPRAWALMIAGFGLCGATLRRRRRLGGLTA